MKISKWNHATPPLPCHLHTHTQSKANRKIILFSNCNIYERKKKKEGLAVLEAHSNSTEVFAKDFPRVISSFGEKQLNRQQRGQYLDH